MHRLILICLALAACNGLAPTRSGPMGYRKAGVQMYSTAAMPTARLIGRWRQEAGFGAACAQRPRGAEFFVQDAIVQVAYHLCLNGRIQTGQGALAGGQGRYRLPNLSAPIWVLWIDGDNRSMAIGTPDGSLGLILSKDPIPRDRMRAAGEILAWNGYDLTKMITFP